MTPTEALARAYDAHRWDALVGDEIRDALDYAAESIDRLRALGEATAAMLMVDVQPSALILGSPHTPRVQHWRRQIWSAMVDAAIIAPDAEKG